MDLQETRAQFLARETTIREDFAALHEEETPESMNLREDQTGVPGVIFISTAMGPHGPRVKWFAARPREGQPSLSVVIGEEPRVVATSLNDRDTARAAPAVIAWVRQNRDVLIDYWNERDGLFAEETAAYLARMRKV